MIPSKKVLIIGFGSIGSRHAKVAIELGHEVTIVDPRVPYMETLPRDTRGYVTITDLQDDRYDYCVIANWGPEHIPTMSEIFEQGLSESFIIEKPMAVSFDQINAVNQRMLAGNLRFLVAATKHYCGLDDAVGNALGSSATSVSVFGGAQCMSTIGYHWLDFAIRLFGANPTSVFADLNDSPINPRSESLSYLEGSASFRFPEGQMLTMTFDNKSSISATTRVLGRNEVVDIIGEYVIRTVREDELLILDSRVTRTSLPNKEVSRKKLLDLEHGMKSMHASLFESPPDLSSMGHDLSVASYMLLALESSDSGSRLSLGSFLKDHEGAYAPRRIS